MDIFERIFGVKVIIDSSSFKRKFVQKNPYIVGEWVEDGKKFTVYVGKDGFKIVPFEKDVLIKFIFSLRVWGEKVSAVFVDGNTNGFSLLFVREGKVEKFLVKFCPGTSNSNELRAIEFALSKFPETPVFSDSNYAISVIKKLEKGKPTLHKVKAHEGNIWNTICDYMLRKFLENRK